MSNSNVQTAVKTNSKNTTKSVEKQLTAAELQKQIEKLENERLEMIADLRSLEDEKTDLSQEVEKTLLENATLKANAKHDKEGIEKQIAEVKKEAEQALKAAIKPTHRTATEKQESLQELNRINLKLIQKNDFYKSFIAMLDNSSNEQIQISFIPSKSENLTFATSDLVKHVCNSLIEYMQKNISELEQELLLYQI